MKIDSKWRVLKNTPTEFRSRPLWRAISPWSLTERGRYIRCTISEFSTWREAFDYADRMANA